MRGKLFIPLILLTATSLRSATAQLEKPPVYNGKTFAQWMEILENHWHPDRQLEARKVLGPDGPYAKIAIPELINTLKDRMSLFDNQVEETLVDYGPQIIPVLIKALKRPESNIKVGVITTLGRFESKAEELVPVLLRELKDPSADIREAAASALGDLGSEAAVPA